MPKVPEQYLEDRRRSIIDAASRVFERKGIQAATMAEIAGEAGLTPGAIYRYFDSKDDLALGCFRANADTVARMWAEPVRDGSAAIDELDRLATALFTLLDDPHSARDTIIYLEHTLDRFREGGPLDGGSGSGNKSLEDLLAKALEAGRLPPEADPKSLADALASFYWGARLLRLSHPKADTMKMLRQVLLILRAAAPRE